MVILKLTKIIRNINCNILARKSSVRGKIDCDFKAMYGDAFAVLNDIEPEAVL
jgi:hypothetical protein